MSGIEDPGTPPDLPQEYADVYREAYLRALAEDAVAHPVPEQQHDVAVPSDDDEDEGGRSGRLWLIVAVVALLLIIAAYVAGDLLSDDAPEPTGSESQPTAVVSKSTGQRPTHEAGPTDQPSEESRPGSSLGPVWDGAVQPVSIESAEATCTAPEGVDSSNKPVSYAIGNAIDSDPSTAWRCNGKGRGETITFTLPDEVDVAEVGLVPGYAKTDPASGTDRYAENNRITRVRWTLAPGVVVDQELDPNPGDRSLQSIRVPRTATGSVTLEILSVKSGGRNTTAISSVLIAAAS